MTIFGITVVILVVVALLYRKVLGQNTPTATPTNTVESSTDMQKQIAEPLHSNLDLAFTNGHVFTGDDDKKMPTAVVHVGDLEIHSGKVMACDPGIIAPKEANSYTFEQGVPSGKFPVYVSQVTVDTNHNRIAAAKVQFSDKPVISWKMALRPGQRLEDLKDGERFGYGVDCGVGCFADPDIFKNLPDNEYNEETTDKLFADMDENGGDWGSISLPKGNLIAVHSGWGDGFYPSFWGFDSSGNPVCLATDFEVLVTYIPGSISITDLPKYYGTKFESTELKEGKIDIKIDRVEGKPHNVILHVTGSGASALDIDHMKTELVKQSKVQYTKDGKDIEIEFTVDPSKVDKLPLRFSKGSRAYS